MAAPGPMVFVLNPRSAAGATLRRFERVRGRFQAALPGLQVWLTERPGHATELARRAIRQGARAVVAVGGDGTNNEVVNGFFDEDGHRLAGDTAFGVVTSGTGGDFRRTFGWPADPLSDLERLARGVVRRIDVGRARFATREGGEAARYFVNIGSFGISGRIVDTVNRSSKALGARTSFIAGTLRNLVGYRPQRVRVTCDDGPPQDLDITVVAVANGQYFGGGMCVAPDAKVDDGILDAVQIEGGGLPLWLQHGAKIYSGRHAALPEVCIAPVRGLRAEPLGSEEVLVELDGEQPGRLPATFEVLPAAIPLLA